MIYVWGTLGGILGYFIFCILYLICLVLYQDYFSNKKSDRVIIPLPLCNKCGCRYLGSYWAHICGRDFFDGGRKKTNPAIIDVTASPKNDV